MAGSLNLPERSSPPPAGYFADVPSSHNGVDPFTVGLNFTEDVPLIFRTLRDHALSATNGAITKAKRATQGSSRVWGITVQPVRQPTSSSPCSRPRVARRTAVSAQLMYRKWSYALK